MLFCLKFYRRSVMYGRVNFQTCLWTLVTVGVVTLGVVLTPTRGNRVEVPVTSTTSPTPSPWVGSAVISRVTTERPSVNVGWRKQFGAPVLDNETGMMSVTCLEKDGTFGHLAYYPATSKVTVNENGEVFILKRTDGLTKTSTFFVKVDSK